MINQVLHDHIHLTQISTFILDNISSRFQIELSNPSSFFNATTYGQNCYHIIHISAEDIIWMVQSGNYTYLVSYFSALNQMNAYSHRKQQNEQPEPQLKT